jgi:hypothetical protein
MITYTEIISWFGDQVVWSYNKFLRKYGGW